MSEKQGYLKGQLKEIFGVSRDTLRYYESKGILYPKKKKENNYREYDIYDIYTLMVADFYKKRGLSMKEVKEIKALQSESGIDEIRQMLSRKETELEENIRNQKRMLKRIRETKEFSKTIEEHLGKYCIKELPLYEVMFDFSDFIAFEEYRGVLQNMNAAEEDILSKVMRIVKFDKTGITDTNMYIVEHAKRTQKKKNGTYLDYPKCAYTIVEDGRYSNEGDHLRADISDTAAKWAKEQRMEFIGVGFGITRLISYRRNKERTYLEIFIPIR